jgi:hypothetical protein
MPTGTRDVHPRESVDKELNRLSGSYYIFLIVMVLVFLGLTVMFSVNAYYFGQINGAVPSDGSVTIPGGLTKTDVEALFYTNIAFAIISVIIFSALVLVLILGIWKLQAVEKGRALVARVTGPVGTRLAVGTREAALSAGRAATSVGEGTLAGARAGVREIGRGLGTGASELGAGTLRTGKALVTGQATLT